MWDILNQCKAEMLQGLETEAKNSRVLWGTATPSPWNTPGTEITYFAVSPSSSWSGCSLCNPSQLFSQALEVLLLDNSFQSFYQHSKAPASSLFLCWQRGLWSCGSSREESDGSAVQEIKSYFSTSAFPDENIYSNACTVHFCRITAPSTIQSGNYNLMDSKLCSTNRIHPPATTTAKYLRVYKNLGHNAVGSGFSNSLDPLVEITFSRGGSSYTFLQGVIITRKQREAWNRLENTL